MWKRPEDCPTEEVHALMEQDHPVGIGPFETPQTGYLAVLVPTDTPMIELARAFASIGYSLRGKRNGLIAEPITSAAVMDAVQRSGTGKPGSIEEC